MHMLDLFAGSGGASRAAKVRGWKVTRIDNAPGTAANLRLDLTDWQTAVYAIDRPVDLLWASPPCTALSTVNQKRRDIGEGMLLVRATIALIQRLEPRWWVLENVHGATRAIGDLLGPPVQRHGSFYLWGNFPPFTAEVPRDKTKKSGRRRAERRAEIPYAISDGLVRACEALARELAGETG
jgi:C-5 cytosine-specific DNA methylase